MGPIWDRLAPFEHFDHHLKKNTVILRLTCAISDSNYTFIRLFNTISFHGGTSSERVLERYLYTNMQVELTEKNLCRMFCLKTELAVNMLYTLRFFFFCILECDTCVFFNLNIVHPSRRSRTPDLDKPVRVRSLYCNRCPSGFDLPRI